MKLLADVFVALVALLHVYFLVLEMFLWDKPLGLSLGAAGTSVKLFFLACVIVAGVYGAATVGKKILFVQALPAAIALALVLVAD